MSSDSSLSFTGRQDLEQDLGPCPILRRVDVLHALARDDDARRARAHDRRAGQPGLGAPPVELAGIVRCTPFTSSRRLQVSAIDTDVAGLAASSRWRFGRCAPDASRGMPTQLEIGRGHRQCSPANTAPADIERTMIPTLPHPIDTRWPANDPSILQLYSFPTPNGVKVSIMLEEIGLPYEAHTVSLSDTEVKSEAFLSLNPNGKIPAIIDPDGPDGRQLALFESGAILIYLADKSGQLLPSDPIARYQAIQWVMFQMGGIGPMFGQYGFFSKFAGSAVEDPLPRERYRSESVRLLEVLEQELSDGRQWLCGADYTIADIAIFPWIRGAKLFYEAGEAMEMDSMPSVMAWLERCIARPASVRGLEIPARG